MFRDQTSFSKMIGFSCLGALSMLLVSARIERPAFASVDLAADTMKLNHADYSLADKDGDDDDDCQTRKADYSLADKDGDDDDDCQTRKADYSLADKDGDDDDDCQTRKADYSLADNKNHELTAITGAMIPKSVQLTL